MPFMSELVIDGHRIGVLFSEAEIAARVKVIAAEIAARKPANFLNSNCAIPNKD